MRVVVRHDDQIRLLDMKGTEVARQTGKLLLWNTVHRGSFLSLGDKLIDPTGTVLATGRFGRTGL